MDQSANKPEAEREVIVLQISRRELDFIGRASLVASAYIRASRGDPEMTPQEQASRIGLVVSGYERIYDHTDVKAFMEKLSLLGSK